MSLARRYVPHLLVALSACLVATACDESANREDDAGAAVSSDASAAATSSADASAGSSVGSDVAEMPERPEIPEQPEQPERAERPESSDSRSASSKPTFAEERDGGVSMKTRNGTMVMSLRHDSVVVAFSDSMRLSIQKEMKQSMDEENGKDENSAIGEMIKGVVKSTVTSAMREVFEKSRGFPVSDLRDVSYESGAIQFNFAHKPTWNFEHINSDDEPLLEQFHPADAARFVGAVRAHMKR